MIFLVTFSFLKFLKSGYNFCLFIFYELQDKKNYFIYLNPLTVLKTKKKFRLDEYLTVLMLKIWKCANVPSMFGTFSTASSLSYVSFLTEGAILKNLGLDFCISRGTKIAFMSPSPRRSLCLSLGSCRTFNVDIRRKPPTWYE